MVIIGYNVFHPVCIRYHMKKNMFSTILLGSTSSTSAITVAGVLSTAGSGYSELYYPTSIFVDPDGIMYIMDLYNYRVVRWLPGEPLGFTVAGGHGYGVTLDKIGYSYAIYLDDQSNIYISDNANHRVTKWLNGNQTSGIRVCINRTRFFHIYATLNWFRLLVMMLLEVQHIS